MISINILKSPESRCLLSCPGRCHKRNVPRSRQGVLAKTDEAQSSVRLLQERNIYILLVEASFLSFVAERSTGVCILRS